LIRLASQPCRSSWADGALGERARRPVLVILRDQIEPTILGIPVRGGEQDESIAWMDLRSDLVD
jgi:hypothetical protein